MQGCKGIDTAGSFEDITNACHAICPCCCHFSGITLFFFCPEEDRELNTNGPCTVPRSVACFCILLHWSSQPWLWYLVATVCSLCPFSRNSIFATTRNLTGREMCNIPNSTVLSNSHPWICPITTQRRESFRFLASCSLHFFHHLHIPSLLSSNSHTHTLTQIIIMKSFTAVLAGALLLVSQVMAYEAPSALDIGTSPIPLTLSLKIIRVCIR